MTFKTAYLHGLESNNIGQKNDWLRTVSEVFDPLIDYRKPNVYREIKKSIIDFNPNLIIGSSMGGYFAYLLARELNIQAVLFNPALHSRTYQPDITAFNTFLYKPNIYCILGCNDEVINPQKTIEILSTDGYSSGNFIIMQHSHKTPYDVFIKTISNAISDMKNEL